MREIALKKVALVLTGCGHKDGSEITEVVSSMIALSEFGAEYSCFAPNREVVVTNHLIDDPMSERRNMMVEAARIARGQIAPLTELNSHEFDALIIPGGMGAVLHLSTWAAYGAKGKVEDESGEENS